MIALMPLAVAAFEVSIRDEHYLEGEVWQMRSYLDRRFWHTSGGQDAIGFGITDDFGDIRRTEARPLQ